MRRWTLATATLAALALTSPAGAQEIAGVAVDAGGTPLAAIPVALHRVGGGTGATVATGTTDAGGRFQFAVEGADSAVYFVAIRHDDRMYIGPPARAGTERVTEYVVRADEGSEVGAITSALSGAGARPLRTPGAGAGGGGAGSGGAAVGLVLALALAVAAAFLWTAPAYRRRQRRGLLIELAGIENRLDEGGDSDPAGDRRRRDALRERLAPRT